MVTKRRMNFIHTLHDKRYEFYSYPWCHQFHRNNENSYPWCSINKLHKNLSYSYNGYNESPIQHSLSGNNFEVFKILYENGANCDIVDEGGFSILASAVNRNNEKMVRYLVENGAKINPWADDQLSPILIAIEARHINVANYLARNGARLETKAKGHCDSPFFGDVFDPVEMALAHNDLEISKMMIFLKNKH